MKKILPFILLTILLSVLFFLLLEGGRSNIEKEEDSTSKDLNLEDNDMDYSELKVTTTQEGEGEEAKQGDILSVHYTGTLKDGTKFDSSYDRNQPFEFQLGVGGVIQGWDQGMLGMKVGEKRILEIPSTLGYGATGSGEVIPANTGLRFEVELLEIK